MLAGIRTSSIATLLLLLGFIAPVWAQSSSNGPVVFGQASVVKLWDDEGSIGTGVGAGAGLSVPLSASWNLRGRVVRSRNERDFGNGVVFDNTSTRYTAELLWKPTTSPYAPYIGAGLGGFSFEHHSEFGQDPLHPTQTPVQRFTSSGNDLIYGGIAGVTAVSAGRFRLQPEFSLWLSRGWFIQMEFAVLAGFRW